MEEVVDSVQLGVLVGPEDWRNGYSETPSVAVERWVSQLHRTMWVKYRPTKHRGEPNRVRLFVHRWASERTWVSSIQAVVVFESLMFPELFTMIGN